jgi:membrane protein
VVTNVGRDDVPGLAAEMAYHFLFALFPFLIFIAALVGFIGSWVGSDNLFVALIQLLAPLVPPEVQRVINEWVAGVVNTHSPGLLTFGAVGALWSASGGAGTLIKGLNRSYGVREDRPLPQTLLLAVLVTLVLALVMLSGVLLYTFGERFGSWLTVVLGGGEWFHSMWNLTRGPGVTVVLALLLLAVYALLPNVRVGWRRALPGTIFAIVAWIALTALFSTYLANFGSYEVTFGSLGAAVMLMFWMYAVSLILVIGGEINAAVFQDSAHGRACPTA